MGAAAGPGGRGCRVSLLFEGSAGRLTRLGVPQLGSQKLPKGKQCVFIYSQQIDGKAFLLLTQTDIVKVMKIKLGPALKIYNSILMFRNSQDLTEEDSLSGQEARG